MESVNDLEKKMLENNPASGGKKIIAGLVDAAFGFGLAYFVGNYLLPNHLWNSLTNGNPALVIVVGFLLYRILTVMTIEATVGMLVTKIKFLNKDYSELNFAEKFFGAIFIPYNGIRLFDK